MMQTYRQHELVLIGKNFYRFTISLVLTVEFDLLIVGNHPQNNLHQFRTQCRQIQSTAGNTVAVVVL